MSGVVAVPGGPLANPDDAPASLEVRRWFAQAIAGVDVARVMRITPDNGNGGQVSLERALRDEGPFAVRVRESILAVDADHPDREAAFWSTVDEMLREGLEPVVVASGSEGRHHLFVRLEDPSKRAELTAVFRELVSADIRDGNSLIRPPLSPHRSGGWSRLVVPDSVEEALSRLGHGGRDLSDRAKAKLSQVLAKGERSEADLSLALHFVNAGFAYDMFRDVLVESPAGERYREKAARRGEAEANRNLRVTWDKAVDRVTASPPRSESIRVREELLRLKQAIEGMPWKGQGGKTDLAVLRAHIAVSYGVANLTYRASVRQIAKAADVHPATVSRAHRRLRWVLAAGPKGGPGSGSTWKLKPEAGAIATLVPHAPPGRDSYCCDCTHRSSRDVFRHGGVGKSCHRVWHAVIVPGTVKEIASRFDLDPSTIRRQLRRLEQYGLAERLEGGIWRQKTPEDWAELAKCLRVAGKTEEKRRQLELEQAQYEDYCRDTGRLPKDADEV